MTQKHSSNRIHVNIVCKIWRDTCMVHWSRIYSGLQSIPEMGARHGRQVSQQTKILTCLYPYVRPRCAPSPCCLQRSTGTDTGLIAGCKPIFPAFPSMSKTWPYLNTIKNGNYSKGWHSNVLVKTIVPTFNSQESGWKIDREKACLELFIYPVKQQPTIFPFLIFQLCI